MSVKTVDDDSDDREDRSSTEPSDDGEETEPIVSLVAGKERRQTAGNRLSSLLQQEGDDELELLFAEDEAEEDNDFEAEGDDDGSDAHLDSSSDEEDQGHGKGDDELEGEKELQQQERAEARKKRKAKGPLQRAAPAAKRVRQAPAALIKATSSTSAPATPGPRPKKKSERASWLPTPDDGPTRSSTRKQTIQNRVVVHERMKERETLRVKTLEVMTAAEKRKQEERQKPLTQEERLHEAAKQETRNAKTLNRWEASEKKKRAEQKAKLEALQNRKLEGPVITWWSGLSRWVDGKVEEVGVKAIRKVEAADAAKKQSQEKSPEPLASQEESMLAFAREGDTTGDQSQDVPDEPAPPPQSLHRVSEESLQSRLPAASHGPHSFLDGIHYYASLQSNGGKLQPSIAMDQSLPQRSVFTPIKPTPTVMIASRSLLVLQNIDDNAQRLPEVQSLTMLKKRGIKPQRPLHELCAITAQPAKYRDPGTGLPYADSYAYKEIQRLRKGGSIWSDLLGCYVGPSNNAARGVPERFLQSACG